MTEHDLIALWTKARWHIIVSQFAPTGLLAALVAFLAAGLDDASLSVRIAATGVLLASGILGALVQIAAANEGLAVIDDLKSRETTSAVSARIIASAPYVNIVRFVTPAVFIVVYVALLLALFATELGLG